jgi:hypothetical protein
LKDEFLLPYCIHLWRFKTPIFITNYKNPCDGFEYLIIFSQSIHSPVHFTLKIDIIRIVLNLISVKTCKRMRVRVFGLIVAPAYKMLIWRMYRHLTPYLITVKLSSSQMSQQMICKMEPSCS